ncbi:putative signal peptidase I [Hollandina sp. SP2]
MENNTSIETGRAIGGALFIALLLKLFLFDFMITEGQSMVPAIKPGSILVVNKLAYGLRFPWAEDYLVWWSLPKPGDVVIFYTPCREIAVKRCTGLTENHTFMALGDNSLQSYDSRAYGPIPLSNILGKVFIL